MRNMLIRFVLDSKGRKRKVMLSYRACLDLIEKAEELNCLKAYDKAKSKKPKFSNAEEVFRRIGIKANK